MGATGFSWTCNHSGSEVDFTATWTVDGGPTVASFTLDPSS